MSNLTMVNLRYALSEIYFGNTERESMKYILPLTGNFQVPTVDPAERVSTWLGYQIVTVKPTAMRQSKENILTIPVDYLIRLFSAGRQAEDFIMSTLLWDYRLDVKRIWEKFKAKLHFLPRTVFSRIFDQDGFNTELIWCVDIALSSFYEVNKEEDVLKFVCGTDGVIDVLE